MFSNGGALGEVCDLGGCGWLEVVGVGHGVFA